MVSMSPALPSGRWTLSVAQCHANMLGADECRSPGRKALLCPRWVCQIEHWVKVSAVSQHVLTLQPPNRM